MSQPVRAPANAATPPVLLLAFNRPDLLERVFEAVRAARPARLFIAVDGPRAGRADEARACAECRAVAERVDWECETKTLFRTENLGCKFAISGAITWFFEHVEAGIVLEEDCLPGAAFFPYCAAMLEHYREDPRVGLVSGDNFLPQARWRDRGHGFTRYAFIWGWATWRRAWQRMDRDLLDWPRLRVPGWLERLHGSTAEARYWRRIYDLCYAGRRYDSWAFPWMFSNWKADMLCVYPRSNLVTNIGFDERGTHTTQVGDTNDGVPVAERFDPWPAPPRVATSRADDRVLCRRYYKVRHRPLRRWFRGLTRRVGWWLAETFGGRRRGLRAALERVREDFPNMAGEARVGGRVWRFGGGDAFAADFQRAWVEGRLDFACGEESPLIVDCGAGAGLAAANWLRRHPKARIVAVEPDPAQRELLEKNLGPDLAVLQVVPKALWPRSGRVRFVSMPDGRGRVVEGAPRDRAAHLIEVETVTLSELLRGRDVALLKVSASGAEDSLLGDPGLLDRVARVHVDYHLSGRAGSRFEELLGVLRKAGFRLHVQTERVSQRPFLERGEDEGTWQSAQIFAWR